jgi:hypothetical protein
MAYYVRMDTGYEITRQVALECHTNRLRCGNNNYLYEYALNRLDWQCTKSINQLRH